MMTTYVQFNKIYKDISMLRPEDTLQLVLEAETEEEKDFYGLIGDFLLRKTFEIFNPQKSSAWKNTFPWQIIG